MFSGHYRKVKLLFGLSDIALTALAFEAAYLSRVWLPFDRVFYLDVPVKALLLGFSVLAWVGLGIWMDVYDKLDSGHPRTILRDSFRQVLAGTVLLVAFQYLLRLEVPLSRSFLALFAAYSWVLLWMFRLAAGSLVGVIRREFGAPHYVMVVGTGSAARRLGQALEHSGRHGIRLMGFFSEDAAAAPERIQLDQDYPVYPLGELRAVLRKQVIDDLLFAVDRGSIANLEDELVLCDEEGVRTRMVVDFFPHVNSEVYLERLGSIPLLTFAAAPHDEIRLLVKRLTDIALSGAALLILGPFLLLIALAIRLTSPGPAIFRQVRCGLNGRHFTCYKFRSMCLEAEALRDSLEHLNSKDGAAFKIVDDPRMTRLGRWLRRFSMDELPQLWNVLKGDMSVVGPRPAVFREVDRYTGWQRRRLRMRPGLTCLWALEGRDALDFETWMRMDMEYIDNWSLTLDWKIILLTIPKVLSGKGAH